MNDIRIALRASLLLTLIAFTAPLMAQQFTVTLIPSAPGESTVPIGTAINASGTVTGFLGINTPVFYGIVGEFNGFNLGQPTAASMFDYTPGGGTQDLGLYDPLIFIGGEYINYCGGASAASVPSGINASGVIVGAVCANYGEGGQAFSYMNGTFTPVAALAWQNPVPGAILGSWSTGINSGGTMVGSDQLVGSGSCAEDEYHTWIYASATATLQDLGTLGGGCESYGMAINDSGEVVGVMLDNLNNLHAYLYSNGQLTDLGNLGYQYAAAYGINASGQVTGFSNQCCGLGPAAFLYNPSTGLMQNLGGIGGLGGSQGNAINASAQITGAAYTVNNAALHAFVYSYGTMSDLNSLISASDAAQYTLYNGVAINDTGQIVAWGYLNSSPSDALTLLLTPISGAVPTITPELNGPLGSNGWYVGDVSLNWTVSSMLPITSTVGCRSKTYTANTRGTKDTCTGTNTAGPNSDSVTIKIDTTPPTAKLKVTPSPNAAGWNKAAVTVSFTGTDLVSGISSCTAPLVLSGEGAGQFVTGSCINNAGLGSDAVATRINIDLTPPTVSIATPGNGATYAKGSTVLASYTCADNLSGIADCKGTVASGAAIATKTSGTKTFTVTAKDVAGNISKTQYTYTVE
jgi:probable HAF family extracellular repeat protein